MPDENLFNFIAPLARKEGAWTIEPLEHSAAGNGRLADIFGRLRHIPARITQPPGERPYRFAERGEHGRWLILWIPDNT